MIKIVHSDYYGKYNLTKIATIAVFQKHNTSKEIKAWMDKYHPNVYFHWWASYHQDRSNETFDLWIPMRSDNKSYIDKDSKYYKDTRASGERYIPIGFTDKYVEKWLKASQKFIMEDSV